MFKLTDDNLKFCEPMRATEFSAGLDLSARESIEIKPQETKIIPLGVMIDKEYLRGLGVKKRYAKTLVAYLHIRSSLSAKQGLIQANGVGVIDIDYPNEIGLIVHNPTVQSVRIAQGARVAQVIVMSNETHSLLLDKKYTCNIQRGDGYGSTGE